MAAPDSSTHSCCPLACMDIGVGSFCFRNLHRRGETTQALSTDLQGQQPTRKTDTAMTPEFAVKPAGDGTTRLTTKTPPCSVNTPPPPQTPEPFWCTALALPTSHPAKGDVH